MSDFQKPDDGLMRATATAAREAAKFAQQIEEMEDALSGMKSRLKNLLSETIPGFMDALGVGAFETNDLEITIKSGVKGTLPKNEDKRRAAIDWLAANGGSEIIQTEIVVPLGKKHHNIAEEIKNTITSNYEVEVELGSTVHPQTLCAWARERLASGESFEPEVLGVFVERKAVIRVKK